MVPVALRADGRPLVDGRGGPRHPPDHRRGPRQAVTPSSPAEWSPTARRPTPPTARRRRRQRRPTGPGSSGGDGVARILASGFARVEPARMPKAPVPAAPARRSRTPGSSCRRRRRRHDPQPVRRQRPVVRRARWASTPERMNPYGCSLVYGHPQGPTGARGDRRAHPRPGRAGRRHRPVHGLRRGRHRRGAGRRDQAGSRSSVATHVPSSARPSAEREPGSALKIAIGSSSAANVTIS